MDIRRRLNDALNATVNYNHQNFVSASSISALVTLETVEKALISCGMLPASHQIELIVSRAKRIFAILVLAEQLQSIEEFLSLELLDEDLPLQHDNMPNFGAESSKADFMRIQHSFPPVFESGTHLEISDQVILPFLENQDRAYGSFGTVFRVKLADGHLPGFDQDFVALKKVHFSTSNPWDIILRELETLRSRRHPNIVPLLASFAMYGAQSGYETRSLSMIFPYAEMNMDDWLRLPNRPQYLESCTWDEVRGYLYKCMYELVSALSFLHRELDGVVTAHHDIKPGNILLFETKLKICDLGKSQLVPLNQGSETDGAKGTFTYQPPEYYNEDGTRSTERQGRQFDMWSIGCIFLEVATVIVYGWEVEEVREFRKQRINSPQWKDIKHYKKSDDDSFHNHIEIVATWEQKLREDGSLTLERCLNIVNGMMEMKPDDRIYSWEAELDFFQLLYPDQSRAKRLAKGALCVQPPKANMAAGTKTPLHRAIMSGNTERQRQLKEAGWSDEPPATPEQPDDMYNDNDEDDYQPDAETLPHSPDRSVDRSNPQTTPIPTLEALAKECLDAAKKKDWAVVNSMLSQSTVLHDTLASSQDPQGFTVLHFAARGNQHETVELILRKLKDWHILRKEDEGGMTALHHACLMATQPVLAAMVQTYREYEKVSRQALIWVKDHQGRTPLHGAALAGNADAVRLLLQVDTPSPAPVYIDQYIGSKRRPQSSSINFVVKLPDDAGYKAAGLAALYDREEVLKILLPYDLKRHQ